MYINHSLFDAENRGSYSDTPVPRVFGNVSPLDPQLFYRINDYADDLLSGEVSGKYSPLEVAQWLDEYVEAARQSLSVGIQKVQGREPSPGFQTLSKRRSHSDGSGPVLRSQVSQCSSVSDI